VFLRVRAEDLTVSRFASILSAGDIEMAGVAAIRQAEEHEGVDRAVSCRNYFPSGRQFRNKPSLKYRETHLLWHSLVA
jgi:hypothetical protein